MFVGALFSHFWIQRLLGNSFFGNEGNRESPAVVLNLALVAKNEPFHLFLFFPVPFPRDKRLCNFHQNISMLEWKNGTDS